MGWLNINGNWIGRHSGKSWSSYCTPLNLVLAEITGGIRLTWEQTPKCTDEDGYEIWISMAGAAYVLLDTVAADVLTYDDMTDYAGSTVEYKVRAYRGTVYSEYSAEAEIIIAAAITNFAVVWAEDHAVLTWDEQAGWDTEIYSSLDNTNWTLEETITTGTETYLDHCWQGTTVYFRARPRSGAVYGDYCASVNIVTPLVFKWDGNPKASLVFDSHFDLAAGKTVRVSWGGDKGEYNDYTTTQVPTHIYLNETQADPHYVQISGDISDIKIIWLFSKPLAYGDISKWILPSSLTSLYLDRCKFSGDLSNWVLPATITIIRLYNTNADQNAFTGDLSSWSLPATLTICYISYNAFTAPPRGELKGLEASAAGLYMRDCSCGTAAMDAWLAYANTYFGSNTPIKNSLFQMQNNLTTNMKQPTGGNNNADRLGIIAKYTAAGFTATVATTP